MYARPFCILINSNIFFKAVLINYCQLSGNRFWDTIIQQCFANPFLSNSKALEKILVFANRSHGLSIKPRGGEVGGTWINCSCKHLMSEHKIQCGNVYGIPNAGCVEQSYSKFEMIRSNGRNQLSVWSIKSLWFMGVLNLPVKSMLHYQDKTLVVFARWSNRRVGLFQWP